MAPISNNKLKLGIFSANIKSGITLTKIPERHPIDWDTAVRVAQLADDAGFEVNLSAARWLPHGGENHSGGINHETMTWCAGLAQATKHIYNIATIHIPLFHPVVAAKQLATLDHISDGRAGVNITVGWNELEMKMFGLTPFEKDDGYRYAQEWIDIVKRLWTEEEPFDYKGEYFDVPGAWMAPKPIRKPHPLIVQAGSSEAGTAYAARNADVALRPTAAAENVTASELWQKFRDQAGAQGRTIDIWAGLWVICRDTEKEAQEYYRYVIEENGDWDALGIVNPNLMPVLEGLSEEESFKARARTLAAWGSPRVIGTPDMVAEGLLDLADQGADGVVLIFPNYEDGLKAFAEKVNPRLEKAGVRAPLTA